MKYLNLITAWLKKNYTWILLIAFVFLWIWAQTQSAVSTSKNEKDNFHCKTLCFPQQHELIGFGGDNTCWCYTSETTLKKIDN
tara:strand:+ start:571 stop:819 length:249 start_codon:yes stop_codon:yes gene_type:complete